MRVINAGDSRVLLGRRGRDLLRRDRDRCARDAVGRRGCVRVAPDAEILRGTAPVALDADDLQDSDGNIEPILKDSVLKLVQFITADFPDSSTYKARSVVLTLAEAVSSWFQCNLDAALDDQMIEAHLTEWRDIEVEAELLQRLYKLVPPTRGETYRSASRTTGSTWSSTSCTPRTSYCDAYNPGAWRQVQVVSENTAQTHWSCLYNNLFSRDEDCHFACQG